MISWRMAAGWLVALVVATVLTWQIVGLADSQVGARPAAVAPALPTTSLAATSSTSATQPPTSTSAPTTTTPGESTSSSATSSTSSSSSVSSSSSTSSPTVAAWSVRTVTTTGGSVVVRYRPNEVELQAATPAPGFAVEIDNAGPPRVRVEFENDDIDVRVEFRWKDGTLDVEISGDV